jgi:hypothetical protein
MAYSNPGLSELVTTTLRNRTGKLADNVTKNNGLLKRLKMRGNVKPVSGGRSIVQEMEYAENGTFKRYSGYEAVDVSPSDTFTAAEFNYAQAAVAISISGLEQLQNSGEDAIIDLLEARISNGIKTLTNNIALDCYSDGTADGGRQIGGLQLLVADNPTTGTVGGIDRSTTAGTFYRNQRFRSVTDGGAAATVANIQNYMNRLYLSLVRGSDSPDLIVADNAYYNLYWQSLQAIQRVTSTEEASIGFSALKYMNADVIFDGGIGGGAPTNKMYFLNTDYIFLRPHRDRNFVPMGDDRFAVNQDAMVKLLGFAGNMTLSNASLQGVLNAS